MDKSKYESAAAPAYAELHCISNYSFLRGASFPEELVATARELGYEALAITDECSLSGAVRAHMAAKEHGLKLIVGAGFRLGEGCRLVALARNRKGYGELSHLISCARGNSAKGGYRIDRAMIEQHRPDDCLLLWLPEFSLPPEALETQAAWLREHFAGRAWLAVELLLRGGDRLALARSRKLGERHGLPLCAAGGACMHAPGRRPLRDTLSAIRLGKTIAELGLDGECNGERHLRGRAQLARLYPPELLAATVEIAGRCHFSLDELRYEYPRELTPKPHSPHGWLCRLAIRGMRRRWPEGAPEKVRTLLRKELALIRELRYEHYFLTVHDIVEFARGRGILCQGRGSAANSAVCYCLGITAVDPSRIELLFERFISRERDEPPDIDVDFEHSRREEVIQYIYERYGRHRAALAATVIRYRSRSAVRDVGKALGLAPKQIEHLAKSIHWWGANLKEQLRDANIDPADPRMAMLLNLAGALLGFPRHLSQHVGGFVISQGPLTRLVPVENAAMAGRTVIQWEKDDLEALGLLKVDVLALGMLTAVRKCIELVNSYRDEPLSMDRIPAEDPAVYDMMGRADTIGVFQIESRAQMSMLPRLRPRNYYDLVIQIAIVRPGPIQGDMVHPYLNRRNGREPIEYPSGEVKEVLERTLGVPIFQEQVMKLAMVAAGFSGGEADQLRRAMAAWKRKGGLEPYREKLIQGMLARGYEAEFAERLFRQILGFGDYGFPESHSSSFALLAYVSSWLKRYHPAAFCCALLNSQPMGFYAPAQLIRDAREHGVAVLPVHINHSLPECGLEFPEQGAPRLRIGFNQVKGLSRKAAEAIHAARAAAVCEDPVRGGAGMGAPPASSANAKAGFANIEQLVFRSGIGQKDLEALAAADALRGIAGDRHRAFWHSAGAATAAGGLFAATGFGAEPAGVDVLLPGPDEWQNIAADYNTAGFSLRRHPLALLRERLDRCGAVSAGDLSNLADGGNAKVAGLVTCRQRPMTASGVTFLTLEDESGMTNVVVWPSLGEKQRPAVRQAKLLGVVGHVQKSEGVIHLIARQLANLSHWLDGLETTSRDFC
ncbi:MAG: error-prone DNA polymerase [Gammaproteobacteria bacterium]|nr:error-prone DNA polymerase [Gammaproteobacteria bacterium]